MSWGNFKAIVGLGKKKKSLPDGVTLKCSKCNKTLFRKEYEANLYVCSSCNDYHTFPALERVKNLLDEGGQKELFTNLKSLDPLNFVGSRSYKERIAEAKEKTGLEDAIVCFEGKMHGKKIILACTDSRFLIGSMGSVVGEKVARCFEYAQTDLSPVVMINCGGGGARMDEGVFSLMQMVKTSNAVKGFSDSGGLYISVLTNPTMGGVMASFASLGDVMIAEPDALIGFAGPRVIKQTIHAELPSDFQKSEFLLKHGHIDFICKRPELKNKISQVIEYLKPTAEPLPL